MTEKKSTSTDSVFVWGISDRTGYLRFYYSEEAAKKVSGNGKVEKVTFLEAHELHNRCQEQMFSLPPISLSKFERVIEEATENFHHLFFHSLGSKSPDE